MKTNNLQKTIFKPTLIALAIMHSASAHAAIIHVGGSLGQGCGLSAAILSANQDITQPGSQCIAGNGDDTIELNRDVTVTRSWQEEGYDTGTGMPLITDNLTINGNGHTLNRGSNAGAVRLLRSGYSDLLNGYISLTLNDISLTNGKVPSVGGGEGGAIFAEGDLTINNSLISGNEGAISGGQDIRVIDSVVSNNSIDSGGQSRFAALGGFRGNFLDLSDPQELYVKNSQFENNQGSPSIRVAGEAYFGYDVTVNIIDSSISNNSGAGIDLRLAADVEIDNTTISGNSGRGVNILGAEGKITNSVITNNVDTSCAGAKIAGYYSGSASFSSADSVITISDSTLSNNTATESYGGAVCSVGRAGLYNQASSSITIRNSTLTGNSATTDGGAIFEETVDRLPSQTNTFSFPRNSISLINSTISDNNAGGSGGGIFLDGEINFSYRGSRLTLLNSTIVGNSAAVNAGGIEANSSYLNFYNSIISGNLATGAAAEIHAYTPANFTGAPAIDASKNNLFGTSVASNSQALSGFVPSNSDITATSDGTNPTQLASIIQPLSDNGGATLTHALPVTSPAVDSADNAVCNDVLVNAVDQRNKARNDGQCDIGSYEVQANPIGLPRINVSNIQVSEGANEVTLSITLSEPQPSLVKVDYQTVDGTANDGLDYAGRSGQMTFTIGQTTKIRIIQLVNDNLAEDLESFSMVLSNPVGAELAQSIAQVDIIDDDQLLLPTINVAEVFAQESDGQAVVAITLSQPSTEPVSVAFRSFVRPTQNNPATPGVDYVDRSGTITFAPGATRRTRTMTLIDDSVAEANEVFRFELSQPTNAEIASGSKRQRVFILNDD